MVLYRLRRYIARRFFPFKYRTVNVPIEFDRTVSILIRRA